MGTVLLILFGISCLLFWRQHKTKKEIKDDPIAFALVFVLLVFLSMLVLGWQVGFLN